MGSFRPFARTVVDRLFAAILASLVLGIVPPCVADTTSRTLWRESAVPRSIRRTPMVRTSIVIDMDFATLRDLSVDRFNMRLPSLPAIDARWLRAETPAPGVLVRQGRIEGDSLGTVMIATVGGAAVGTILTSSGQRYRLRMVEGGGHVIEDVDPDGVPDESDPDTSSTDDGGDEGYPACETDSPDRIDVLVVYTTDARVEAGGPEAMEATIHLAVAETNQAYLNSGVLQRIQLVHLAELSYVETGILSTDKTNVQTPGDGLLDEVHTLRNQFGADLVALIVKRGNSCGLSNIMEEETSTFENQAFSVIRLDCATGNYSFGHELGHLMSARHERPTDSNEGKPFEFNHGYIKLIPPDAPTRAWRTMMAYKRKCEALGIEDNCPRLPYWSNPDVLWQGDPMGDSQTDNQEALNLTAPLVVNFRCSNPGRNDVWMKDAWADTGAEPEPALAQAAMWKSPYIWVRNAPDPDRIHEHQHANPESGQMDYIYVKLHGGTMAINGTLEMYTASASTDLRWPSDWTRVGSSTLTVEPGTTRILEFPWPVSVTGHHCLLARWDSAEDLMAVPEGVSVEDNVRANNNIVWRNLNIVDLVDGADEEVLLSVGNPSGKDAKYSFFLRPGPGSLDAQFLDGGWVRLRAGDPGTNRSLPPELQSSFLSQTVTAGLVSTSEGLDIHDVRIPARSKGSFKLRFGRRHWAGKPPATYVLDFIQVRTYPGPPRLIGGVSYEIRTRSSRRQ